MSRPRQRACSACDRAQNVFASTTSRCFVMRSRCTPKCTVGTSLQHFVDSLTVGTVVATIVDVALVYYLIYRLLLTIRGTRAAQMIVGIVLIGTSFLVAERLGLSTVSWLLDNL